jgi:hypothetical protein
VIPKEFLEGIQAVEIWRENDQIILTSAVEDDSIQRLGSETLSISKEAFDSPKESAHISKDPLGQRLRELRAKIVDSGEGLLTIEDIEQEIAEQRDRLGYLGE